MPIEHGVVPEAVDARTSSTSELEMMRRGERTYLVARRAARVVGYAGHDVRRRRRPRHEHRRRAPSTSVRASPRGLLAELAWAAHRAREHGDDARGAGQQPRRAGAVPTASASSPPGIRKNYYENVEDAIVMWCHDIARRHVPRPPARAVPGGRPMSAAEPRRTSSTNRRWCSGSRRAATRPRPRS